MVAEMWHSTKHGDLVMSEYTRIIKGEPIDKVARRVLQRGTHHDFVPDPTEQWTDIPLETKPFPATCSPSENLTGMKFGRVTVIGLSVIPNRRHKGNGSSRGNGGKGPKWVVRCACGYYTIKRSRTLLYGESVGALMCSRCFDNEQRRSSV